MLYIHPILNLYDNQRSGPNVPALHLPHHLPIMTTTPSVAFSFFFSAISYSLVSSTLLQLKNFHF